MATSTKKPNYSADVLPDESVMNILIRLPGKQVARCKCVCKSWRSVIKSAHFKDVYGNRQRGLILHWFQPVFNKAAGLDISCSPLRLNIFYSPFRGLEDPEPEEFSWLCELGTYGKRLRMTQIVNGLVCVDRGFGGIDTRLTIYNVCTGEGMRIPNPLPPVDKDDKKTRYHLGYDPASKMYKLLRIMRLQIQVHVMTLRPSSSSSTWRELSCDGNVEICFGEETRTSASDGFLCWMAYRMIILFDLNNEKFQKILLVHQYTRSMPYGVGFVRAQFMEHPQRLAVFSWIHQSPDIYGHTGCIKSYVMDDDEGKIWSQHHLDLPKEKPHFVIADGNLCTRTGEMVLVNVKPGKEVCCYGCDHTIKEVARFQVGTLPAGRKFDFHPKFHKTCSMFLARFSCLFDGNNLYLPLDEILGGQV